MADMLTLTIKLPEHILEAIGRVTVAVSQFEYVLALTIKRTTGRDVDQALRIAREAGNLRTLADKVKMPFEVFSLDQVQEGELRCLLDEGLRLSKLRNDVVHGLWALDGNEEVRWIRTRATEPADPLDLDELAHEISLVTARINAITRPDLVSFEGQEIVSWGSPPDHKMTKGEFSVRGEDSAADAAQHEGPTGRPAGP